MNSNTKEIDVAAYPVLNAADPILNKESQPSRHALCGVIIARKVKAALKLEALYRVPNVQTMLTIRSGDGIVFETWALSLEVGQGNVMATRQFNGATYLDMETVPVLAERTGLPGPPPLPRTTHARTPAHFD